MRSGSTFARYRDQPFAELVEGLLCSTAKQQLRRSARTEVMTRTLLRPTGFVNSPFGHDGKVARLAGGMNWFAAVELIRVEGHCRISTELVPVEGIEDALRRRHGRAMGGADRAAAAACSLASAPSASTSRRSWASSTSRPTASPMAGNSRDPAAAAAAGADMAAQGAAIIDVGGKSTRPGAKPVWEGDEIERIAPVDPPARGGRSGGFRRHPQG